MHPKDIKSFTEPITLNGSHTPVEITVSFFDEVPNAYPATLPRNRVIPLVYDGQSDDWKDTE